MRTPSMWPSNPLLLTKDGQEASIKQIKYQGDCDLVLFHQDGRDRWLVLDLVLSEGWLVKEV